MHTDIENPVLKLMQLELHNCCNGACACNRVFCRGAPGVSSDICLCDLLTISYDSYVPVYMTIIERLRYCTLNMVEC